MNHELPGNLIHLFSPLFPLLHSFNDNVVLCGEVVPVFPDLLLQVVVVHCDVCMVAFSRLGCSQFSMVRITLDVFCGYLQLIVGNVDGVHPGV